MVYKTVAAVTVKQWSDVATTRWTSEMDSSLEGD